MFRDIIICLILLFGCEVKIYSQIEQKGFPLIGAQVFIEPGQTEEETEIWFRQMKKCGMSICRIRMFETYMKDDSGKWNFSLFDRAFRIAEKYDIKILATLFPTTAKTDIGGYKFPVDDITYDNMLLYIKNVVLHFKQFSSLYGWVLINEPGTGGNIPYGSYTAQKYEEWRENHPDSAFDSRGYPILITFTDQRFLLDYNTWFLSHLASEVKKYDTESHIHVNNHAIFDNCGEYDFPKWRAFLNSLGGSAHPSWHFNYFSRDQYTLAMSANSEILRSGAGNIPWIMTEIQGGNNTYSGYAPFCPTFSEIEQWLWTTIGSGSKGAIFWCLNSRVSGLESGEWALLDFQNNFTDRMGAICNVTNTLTKYKKLFSEAQVEESGVSVIYVRESLWAENKMLIKSDTYYNGRARGGVIKSALSFFEVLTYMGMSPSLKEIGEFDFDKQNYDGQTIILSHQISLPLKYKKKLERFVTLGGTLIIDGLSGYYDENMINVMKSEFPFAKLWGGDISEFKALQNIFEINIDNMTLPTHLWQGIIRKNTGHSISKDGDRITGIRNKWGRGKVVWIPSLIGLGGWIEGYKPLSNFLYQELDIRCPIHFKHFSERILMRILKSGDSYITILINKSDVKQTIKLNTPLKFSQVIYPEKKVKVSNKKITLSPEETCIIKWDN
ncbi:beta-galactosidase trimerization domain-containing protein [Gabonia massiliensis]|jgi:hypothetical protein|uniref:beta-galactosidase trimerization domain-containing protein n=3 Tax=Bacteroidales TaxID=171549 RepID=UPI000573A66C|nr:beta-galactosidase trimerization domain-containing protein [Gabonia massiliensis]KHM44800.1 hypothetical protein PU94_13895 [Coprobacter secundus]